MFPRASDVAIMHRSTENEQWKLTGDLDSGLYVQTVLELNPERYFLTRHILMENIKSVKYWLTHIHHKLTRMFLSIKDVDSCMCIFLFVLINFSPCAKVAPSLSQII